MRQQPHDGSHPQDGATSQPHEGASHPQDGAAQAAAAQEGAEQLDFAMQRDGDMQHELFGVAQQLGAAAHDLAQLQFIASTPQLGAV